MHLLWFLLLLLHSRFCDSRGVVTAAGLGEFEDVHRVPNFPGRGDQGTKPLATLAITHVLPGKQALNRWTKGEPYAEAVKEFA